MFLRSCRDVLIFSHILSPRQKVKILTASRDLLTAGREFASPISLSAGDYYDIMRMLGI